MHKKDISSLVKNEICDSPSGNNAKFIPLNDRWAIKVFDYSQERDIAYYWQKKAAFYGLAPNVGGKIDLEDGEYRWGYVTEIIEPLVPHEKMKGRNNWAAIWPIHAEWEDEIKQCCVDLLDIGVDVWSDIHAGNFGQKDGKVLCLDFGHCSSNIDES